MLMKERDQLVHEVNDGDPVSSLTNLIFEKDMELSKARAKIKDLLPRAGGTYCSFLPQEKERIIIRCFLILGTVVAG